MQINCDRQLQFDADTCYHCKRMDYNIGGKMRRNWICKLNRTAAEKRSFYILMASDWLIGTGTMLPSKMPNTEIAYVGKKRPQQSQPPVNWWFAQSLKGTTTGLAPQGASNQIIASHALPPVNGQ